MLSTFLSQLQSYFSKYFVIGSFCPILAFTFMNGATAYVLSASWRAWIDRNIFNSTAGRGAFAVTSITVAMVLLAYVLSSLGTFLRQLLEGRWWRRLAKPFVEIQNKRRAQLATHLEKARRDIIDLQSAPKWTRMLQESRAKGKEQHKDVGFVPATTDLLEVTLKRWEELASKREDVPVDQLEESVNTLSQRLQEHDVDKVMNNGSDLDKQQTRLIILINYASERSKARYARLLNDLHSSFGSEEVAATKMGNIANTIQGYALRRYRCNLEAILRNLHSQSH